MNEESGSREREYVEEEDKEEDTEKERKSTRKERFKLETPGERKVRTPSVRKFFSRRQPENVNGRTAGNKSTGGTDTDEYSGLGGSGLGDSGCYGSNSAVVRQAFCNTGNKILSEGRLAGEITQQQRLVGAQCVGSEADIRSLGYQGYEITGFERQKVNSTEQLCAAKQANQTDTHY